MSSSSNKLGDIIKNEVKKGDDLPVIELKKPHVFDNDLFFSELCEKIKESKKKKLSYITKSENIIKKLNNLKDKASKAKDSQGVEMIEWIIKTINEQNLDDIDSAELNNLKGGKNQSGLEYLMQYSNAEDTERKTRDFQSIRKSSRYSYFSSATLKPGSINFFALFKNKGSPSKFKPINKRTENILNKASTIDFDIFQLNNLEETKTTVLLANKILRNISFVETQIVPIDILNNFIEKVVSGYSRQNAIYHNDLHAGDVMQTLNTFFVQGDLQKVNNFLTHLENETWSSRFVFNVNRSFMS